MTQAELQNALRAAGIENFSGEARILLEEFGEDEAALAGALRRRCSREPLQYIIGRWPFFREEYFVSPDCLIPRADTEVLVEHLVKVLPRGARFLDLCTGSGCIAISLQKNRPDLVGAAADISEGALAMAKKNAAHNGVSAVEFFRADVTKLCERTEQFDCIVSNPPYIRTAVVDTLEAELMHEPRIALDGGEDGMDFYRAIVEQGREWLVDGGWLFFEIGYDQGEDLKKLLNEFGYTEIEIRKDLAGLDRVVLGRKGAV